MSSNKKKIKRQEPEALSDKVIPSAGGAAATMIPGFVGLGGLAITPKSREHTFEEVKKAVGGKVADGTSFIDSKSLHIGDILKGKSLGQHYNPEFGYVYAPSTHPGLVAHEVAHSTSPMLKNKAGRFAYGLGMPTGTIGSLYGAVSGAKGHEMSGKEIALSTLPTLPMLGEETRANLLAARAAYRLGGKKGLLIAAPGLIGSELSYLGMAASPYIANKASLAIKKFREERKKNKK